MSLSSISSPNTSPTPNDSGRWIVTEFGTPSVMKWTPWDPTQELSDENNVLVRIIVAGIAGVDNIQRVGGYPDPITAAPGFATGYELVGEVVALSDSIPKDCDLKVGDRVTSLCKIGAHATHIVKSYNDLIKIEQTDDPVKICALPLNYMTSWGMLKRSGVELPPGSTILIGSASGGLGTAVAQLVKAFKMDIRMIGTCSPSKFDYVRSLGIEPLDRNAADLVDQVLKLTGGEGVDVAYDAVCSEESIKNFSAATKADGKVIVVGVSGPYITKLIKTNTEVASVTQVMGNIANDGSKMFEDAHGVLAKRLSPPRITFFMLDVEFYKKPEIADFWAIVDKVRTGELDPVVAKLLPLSQSVEAHEMLIAGTAIKGKLLFIVDQKLAAEYGI
jgi:NADPH2:quinone reductase